jgi:thiamine pyrophosphate-dependent acetolactate synthase large subunit-like protein
MGPVFIDLPMDIQKSEIDPDLLEGYNSAIWEDKFDLVSIEQRI